tara:strand:- start:49 stop:501 length:453 start_codon:yes stop_codon:yes gene_type:complete
MVIDANGHINKPLQPAFFARPSSQQANIDNETILFGNEVFDQNGDYDASTSTFTAPVTGKYQINIVVRGDNIAQNANFHRLAIVSSNLTLVSGMLDPAVLSSSPGEWYFQGCFLIEMDANDTVHITYSQSGGGSTTDIEDQSYFSGFLAC